ncbi:MAG: site-specific integrase [Patescibacteria group bacterium]
MPIYKHGTKYWVDFWFDRIRYRKPSPDNTLKGARAYEVLLRSKLARGESIKLEKIEELITFNNFSKIWLEKYVRVNNKPSELRNKTSALNCHLLPFFGLMPIDKIRNENIEEFKAKKQMSGLGNKSINNLLVILSKCLNTALDWQQLEKIPKIKHLKAQRPSFDYLTETELQRLLNSATGQTKEMILMVSKTGLRFGELIALDWHNIDLGERPKLIIDKSIVRGIVGSTKGYKIRYIPLVNEIYEMLNKKEDKNGLLFQNNSKCLNQETYIDRLHVACRKAGLRSVGWHSLRHTFASHLAMKGITMIALQQLLGHSSITTTMIYAHLSPSSLNDSIKLLELPEKK